MLKKIEEKLRDIMQVMEIIIAVITLLVLAAMLAYEVYKIFTVQGYFSTVDNYLHNILGIVVGLEFVRMLIDLTPGNILEVLTVAISRYVIISHEDPVSNIACILCIAALFATRRFLVPKKEMQVELSEQK